MSKQTQPRKPAVFLTITAFKTAMKITKLEVFRWDKDTETKKATNKLHCQDEFGNIYRCQQDIDKTKPMRMMLEKGAAIEDACLINVVPKESAMTLQFAVED